MLSHATTRDWLIPYADGMLAADERRRIDGHIAGCAACAAELREVRELNLLLVTLPPAPPVAFAPFWSNLQAVLPQRRVLRIPSFPTYRRFGLALAAATVALLAAAGSAFAAPSALPDNPLYPVKQLEEGIRMTFTPSHDRLALQLQLASERLREAQAMASDHKPLLAENSLRAFRLTINEAAAALSGSPGRAPAGSSGRRSRGRPTPISISAWLRASSAGARAPGRPPVSGRAGRGRPGVRERPPGGHGRADQPVADRRRGERG